MRALDQLIKKQNCPQFQFVLTICSQVLYLFEIIGDPFQQGTI